MAPRVWVFPTEIPDGGAIYTLPQIHAPLAGESKYAEGEARVARRRREKAHHACSGTRFRSDMNDPIVVM